MYVYAIAQYDLPTYQSIGPRNILLGLFVKKTQSVKTRKPIPYSYK
jgi:hypothetical protein